ncbi:MAG: hypothetical protein ATN36_02110 [Epulopiscium sp. Nele67-Bin005]|nr:MAG: hypothetical protein ATN36_02110 [Epulopiscium sp. Nele67-Bin005]
MIKKFIPAVAGLAFFVGCTVDRDGPVYWDEIQKVTDWNRDIVGSYNFLLSLSNRNEDIEGVIIPFRCTFLIDLDSNTAKLESHMWLEDFLELSGDIDLNGEVEFDSTIYITPTGVLVDKYAYGYFIASAFDVDIDIDDLTFDYVQLDKGEAFDLALNMITNTDKSEFAKVVSKELKHIQMDYSIENESVTFDLSLEKEEAFDVFGAILDSVEKYININDTSITQEEVEDMFMSSCAFLDMFKNQLEVVNLEYSTTFNYNYHYENLDIFTCDGESNLNIAINKATYKADLDEFYPNEDEIVVSVTDAIMEVVNMISTP